MSNDELMDYLFLNGAIEIDAMNSETNEPMYRITKKMKDIFPDVYREYLNAVNADIMHLWELGFLKIDMTEENPLVQLDPKAFNEEEVSALSENDRSSLNEIKRILLN